MIFSLIGNMVISLSVSVNICSIYYISLWNIFFFYYATAGITLIQLTVTVSLLVVMIELHIKALKYLFHN